MLQRYLMASYGYYIHNISIMADEEFDKLAKDLLKEWGTFEHQHKHLVTKSDLRAGTLYALKEEEYPAMIKGGFWAWKKSL